MNPFETLGSICTGEGACRDMAAIIAHLGSFQNYAADAAPERLVLIRLAAAAWVDAGWIAIAGDCYATFDATPGTDWHAFAGRRLQRDVPMPGISFLR